MIVHDDMFEKDSNEELERYLKQFQPVQADPLPFRETARPARSAFAPMILAASVAVLVLAGAFMLDHHAGPAWDPAETRILNPEQPPSVLTLSDANLLLQQSPSVRDALNSIARDSKNSFPEGKSSAFAALGKESFRL